VVNIDKVIAASSDYLYLKRRGYSIKSILEIVGNRFQLNNDERNVLYRGFFTKKEIRSRMDRLLSEKNVNGSLLEIDGYNQLITIESYRMGRFVFKAMDGIVRDTASVYRSYKITDITVEVLSVLIKNMCYLGLREAKFYFDKPISHSGELCVLIKELMNKHHISGNAETVLSPDYVLKNAGFVATSDSVIISEAKGIFDLAGWLITRAWKPKLVDFSVC
jgi:hypothetical protein